MSDDPMADFLARERAALGAEADLFQTEASPSMEPMMVDSFVAETTETTESTSIAQPPSQPSPQPSQQMSPEVSQFQEEWTSKQREIVEERDRVSTEKHQAMVEEAKRNVDKFYEEYNEKRDKAVEQNRANQELELQAASKGNLWERVLKQIDLATKGSEQSTQLASASNAGQQVRDTVRMRELLQELKRDKDAPGVRPKNSAEPAKAFA
ncbi:Clathrin light chain [Coemansia spiralis]|uniref:Clathrin light chain n=2 Tax=Coemansia TaxID=4863 RepID=A0A9W8G4T4_9FUNG|nr:clathrin light chain [Coemansia spiralis]KAJ1986670.1 Clathrin light chain [Coemansia umbellata]KAJ2623250.1 Clathrin light chain [Coemansia sp. RSA 1358]KAJ2678802.1 Clathrin light chain [Coemansia spiralis]